MSENNSAVKATKTIHDMTTGSPAKLIVQFMIPMFLGNIFQQFYNVADSIIAGIGSDWKYGVSDVFCDGLAERTEQWICDSCISVVWGKAI